MENTPIQKKPTDEDLARITQNRDKAEFLNRFLDLIEHEIVPQTQKGVEGGSKLFGAGILKKSDLSTVVIGTNNEMDNPLMHGEIATIHNFFGIPRDQRPAAKETLFLTTHEPCPLCLSGISWAGFDNFFYLFTYEDTRDAFHISHDLEMNEEIFRVSDGNYESKNKYWCSWGLVDLIKTCEAPEQKQLLARVDNLRAVYDGLSDDYQQGLDGASEIFLK